MRRIAFQTAGVPLLLPRLRGRGQGADPRFVGAVIYMIRHGLGRGDGLRANMASFW